MYSYLTLELLTPLRIFIAAGMHSVSHRPKWHWMRATVAVTGEDKGLGEHIAKVERGYLANVGGGHSADMEGGQCGRGWK